MPIKIEILKELSLCNNQFKHPDSILLKVCQFTDLEKSDISHCNLTSLPKEFSKLKKLKELYLSRNKFKDKSNLSPLCELVSLEYLDLSQCNFSSSVKEELKKQYGSILSI